VYQAKWANSGADPSADGNSGTPTPWSVIGPVTTGETAPTPTPAVSGVQAAWSPETNYRRGDRVMFNDLPYEARWTTKGDAPSTEYPIDPSEPWAALFTVPGEPVVN
jgi:chitinase